MKQRRRRPCPARALPYVRREYHPRAAAVDILLEGPFVSIVMEEGPDKLLPQWRLEGGECECEYGCAHECKLEGEVRVPTAQRPIFPG